MRADRDGHRCRAPAKPSTGSFGLRTAAPALGAARRAQRVGICPGAVDSAPGAGAAEGAGIGA